MNSPELFLDRAAVSWEYNLSRELVCPQRHASNPILSPEYPWEESYVTIYGSVLPSPGGGLQMWYMAGAGGMTKQQFMCHARSNDGYEWKRVMNGAGIRHDGSAPTNIVLGSSVNVHGPCVVENRHSSEVSKQYLALFDSYPQYRAEAQRRQLQDSRWCYSASSADGVEWTPAEGVPAIPGKSDIGQSIVWDPIGRRYIAYIRGTRGLNKPHPNSFGEHHAQRYVRASTSEDFVRWSEPVEVFRCDPEDGDPYHQAHQLSVTRRGKQYVGLLSIFRINEVRAMADGAWIEEGPIDTQLVVSRDGFRWDRVAERQTFFPMGQPGQWDDHWLVTASQIVLHGDKMLFYYGANSEPRRSFFPSPKPGCEYRIGVATAPRDRFQAIRPRRLDQPAILETKPQRLSVDGDLVVNADATLGSLVVELCDFNGQVLEGFSKGDCDPIAQDGLDLPVRWKGRSIGAAVDESKIFQRSIRIRFYLNQASLFAAQWPEAPEAGKVAAG